MYNQGEFVASKEMVDSLKLEASILPPKLENQTKFLAKKVASEFTSMYSQFIPAETLERAKGVEGRILITNDDAFGTMYTDWDAVTIDPSPLDEEMKGICFGKGRIMAFGDPRSYWNEFPKGVQEDLIQKYGSEEKAKQRVIFGCLVNCIAHEIVHQFQNHKLPNYFFECATRYYQRQISDSLHIGHPTEDLEEERINFYKQMIKEFGDNIHRLFFSGNVEFSVKGAILARFNHEAEKLFPQGKGF